MFAIYVANKGQRIRPNSSTSFKEMPNCNCKWLQSFTNMQIKFIKIPLLKSSKPSEGNWSIDPIGRGLWITIGHQQRDMKRLEFSFICVKICS